MSNPTQSTPQPGIGSTCQTNSTESTPQPDSTPQTERQPTTDSDSTVQEAVDQPKLNSRVTSKVWNHFARISSTSAECKHCGKKFAAHSKLNGTTTMNNHLSRCPNNPNKAEKGQLNLIFPPPRPDQLVHVDVTPTVVQEVSIEAIMNSRKKRHRKTSDCVDGKSEVDRYLLDECEPADEKFDILAWWQVNSPKYKILSYMARDILAIPVSSVASESAFSTGKRILGPWRSSLSARTVEALLCTQSWLKKTIGLDFLSEYLPDEPSSIEEEILGPLPSPTNFEED